MAYNRHNLGRVMQLFTWLISVHTRTVPAADVLERR